MAWTRSRRPSLRNSHGVEVHILRTGASIQRLLLPDKSGALADVVLGFDSESHYSDGTSPCFGAMVAASPTESPIRHSRWTGKRTGSDPTSLATHTCTAASRASTRSCGARSTSIQRRSSIGGAAERCG